MFLHILEFSIQKFCKFLFTLSYELFIFKHNIIKYSISHSSSKIVMAKIIYWIIQTSATHFKLKCKFKLKCYSFSVIEQAICLYLVHVSCVIMNSVYKVCEKAIVSNADSFGLCGVDTILNVYCSFSMVKWNFKH